MTSWKVLSSAYTYSDQWIKLRTDDLTSPKGRLIAGYHTLETPDWVNVIAISQSDDVVLIEQYRPSIDRARLELPGGQIDHDEAPDSSWRISEA